MGRGRPVKQGISFYRMDAGHILHPKVRLLFNEFDSDGYYIWHALIDYAYGKWGYYFDMNDKDELELFASEYCKKKLGTIQEVIAGCVRRGLFDRRVADSFGILTSDMMQETFLIATSERRAKDSRFNMCAEWLLLDFSEEHPRNIAVLPMKKLIVPPNNSIFPPKNSQRREEKNRTEESREDESDTPPAGGDGAPAPPVDPKVIWKGVPRNKNAIIAFITEYRPVFIEPYAELWNLFAADRKIPQVSRHSDTRKKKLATRLKEKEFDFVKILTRAGQASDFLLSRKWFSFDWILENESNYLKLLEGNYDKSDTPAGAPSAPPVTIKTIAGLYALFLNDQLQSKDISERHTDFLLKEGLIELDERFVNRAALMRAKQLEGTNNAAELRMIEAYGSGKWPADPDCHQDEPNRLRIAKKLALIDLFQKRKALNLKTITGARPD